MPRKIVFITGTDTGVGKTLLTALLLQHLLDSGVEALAMKPFCSGGRDDMDLLQAIQGSRLSDEAINPFYFTEPVAPLVAARKGRRRITLAQVLQKIRAVEDRCERLLVEGSGGLMVPLGEGYFVADLIQELGCDVIVVARNQLGTLNHTILTVNALRERTKRSIKVVLMEPVKPDFSTPSNRRILLQTLAPVQVFGLPFLGPKASCLRGVKNNAKKVKKTLASLLG